MIRISMALLVLTLMLAASHPAAAFSTEKGSDMFQGNSSNFTDPDEKQPPFTMQLQGGSSSSDQSSARQQSVDPAGNRENYMSMSTGFEHAYQHQSQ